jgi:hypothetical protein
MPPRDGELVLGIGQNDFKYPSRVDRKLLPEYSAWHHMIERCVETYWEKKPTYTGTTCSENFKSYNYFYEWCQSQVGFGNIDESNKSWHLDKDILFKGNKYYSEDTCVFVPQSINVLLTRRHTKRGEHPIGVYWKKKNNQFCVQCADGSGSQKYLGLFSDYSEAFKVYKDFKEKRIKSLANEYKHQLDPRAYEALMNYQVEETD